METEQNDMKNKHSGSDFNDFLKEEGLFEEVKALAQTELEALHTGDMPESQETARLREGSLSPASRIWQWVRARPFSK